MLVSCDMIRGERGARREGRGCCILFHLTKVGTILIGGARSSCLIAWILMTLTAAVLAEICVRPLSASLSRGTPGLTGWYC